MIDTLVTQSNLDSTIVINLLPFVLQEIRDYTNQYFLTQSSKKITLFENGKAYFEGELTPSISVGDSVEFLNSENNYIIYQIKEIGVNYVVTEQELTQEIGNPNITMIKLSFRGVNLKTIVDMLSYSSQFGNSNGIKSQTLGGYSVTFASPEGGSTLYPLELYGGLNSLRKLNDDYKEYWRKGYVRLQ